MFEAEKIGDIGADGRLPTKLELLYAPVAQSMPKLALRWRQRSPQGSRALRCGLWNIVTHRRCSLSSAPSSGASRHLLPQAGEGYRPLSRLRERAGVRALSRHRSLHEPAHALASIKPLAVEPEAAALFVFGAEIIARQRGFAPPPFGRDALGAFDGGDFV